MIDWLILLLSSSSVVFSYIDWDYRNAKEKINDSKTTITTKASYQLVKNKETRNHFFPFISNKFRLRFVFVCWIFFVLLLNNFNHFQSNFNVFSPVFVVDFSFQKKNFCCWFDIIDCDGFVLCLQKWWDKCVQPFNSVLFHISTSHWCTSKWKWMFSIRKKNWKFFSQKISIYISIIHNWQKKFLGKIQL